jgi:hypothetical protein
MRVISMCLGVGQTWVYDTISAVTLVKTFNLSNLQFPHSKETIVPPHRLIVSI